MIKSFLAGAVPVALVLGGINSGPSWFGAGQILLALLMIPVAVEWVTNGHLG